jgi:hypothetical protein
MTSGAVYQSWPYLYEPGFRIQPLIQYDELWNSYQRISKSCNNLDLNFCSNSNGFDSAGCGNSYDLPAEYCLDNNFAINLVNTKEDRKNIKRLRKKRSKNSDKNSFCDSSLSQTSDFVSHTDLSDNDDDYESDMFDDDDSDSYIEYKRRHAIGLFPMSMLHSNQTSHQNSSSSTRSLNKRSRMRLANSYCCEEDFLDDCWSSEEGTATTNFNSNLQNRKKYMNFLSQKRLGENYFNPNDYYILMQQHFNNSNNNNQQNLKSTSMFYNNEINENLVF